MAWRVLDKLQNRPKIGDVLIEQGFLTPENLQAALAKAAQTKMRLGQVLLKEGYLTEKQLAKGLSHQFNMQYFDLDGVIPSKEAVDCIPEAVARQQMVLPISVENNTLTLAVFDPLNVLNIQTVSRITKFELNVKVSAESQLKAAIDRAYSKGDGLARLVKELTDNDSKNKAAAKPKTPEKDQRFAIIENATGRDTASIELLVNKMIERAVSERASDIHIEPDETVVRVRERIDGLLQERSVIPYELYPSVISRMKIMSGLDIAEKRNAQDGRFRFQLGQHTVDLRISTLPTVRGEKVVLRILDKKSLNMKITELGLSQENLTQTQNVLSAPYGIIYVTGPTGSGKSTTVYSMLSHLNSVEKNIITVEDPVEYQFSMINQVQVQPKIGFTFASVLRSILRQDPDIIMVGETRDKETAEISIRAALTGHLVITTLHANSAVATIGRLMDMEIDPSIISSALSLVLSQRLVRKLCKECKEKRPITELEILQLGSPRLTPGMEICSPKGCAKCNHLGFKGRTPLIEVLVPDSEVRKSIVARHSVDQFMFHLRSIGFQSMREDGVTKVLQGITSPAEVLKATLSID